MSFCSSLSSPHSLFLLSKTKSPSSRFRACAADVPDFLSADWLESRKKRPFGPRLNRRRSCSASAGCPQVQRSTPPGLWHRGHVQEPIQAAGLDTRMSAGGRRNISIHNGSEGWRVMGWLLADRECTSRRRCFCRWFGLLNIQGSYRSTITLTETFAHALPTFQFVHMEK
ncbi:uncharacterized protein [Malus domestica]|uniref:uncharacterized protein isoform X2 n=1 Tax=Malus domestica TaxID=3750 RepID=UPI0039768A1C